MEPPNALGRVEIQLAMFRGRQARRIVQRWKHACPRMDGSEVESPSDIQGWVWSLKGSEADDVLRVLVGSAQDGDDAATLAVIACLKPGLLALMCRAHLPLDDVVGQAAVVILGYPTERRRRVAAGILLDVRHWFWVRRQKEPEVLDGDTRDRLAVMQAPGEFGVQVSPPEELSDLVCGAWRAGHINCDDARIILETRVFGDSADVAAVRHGLTQKAVYERRRRAEQRLAEAA